MSWLVSFNVINLRNPMMRQIYYGIESIMKPLMAPIQRVLPSFGGMDFSPIVVLLLLQWLKGYVVPLLYNAVG
jgi:YggT family protein